MSVHIWGKIAQGCFLPGILGPSEWRNLGLRGIVPATCWDFKFISTEIFLSKGSRQTRKARKTALHAAPSSSLMWVVLRVLAIQPSYQCSLLICEDGSPGTSSSALWFPSDSIHTIGWWKLGPTKHIHPHLTSFNYSSGCKINVDLWEQHLLDLDLCVILWLWQALWVGTV